MEQLSVQTRNVIIAYAISLPIGLIFIFLGALIITMWTGGLAFMVIYKVYGWAYLGMFLAFLISIRFAAIGCHHDLLNGRSKLAASFKFSVTINIIIWMVFSLITIIVNPGPELIMFLIPPLIFFIAGVIATPFTIGWLVAHFIEKGLSKLS